MLLHLLIYKHKLLVYRHQIVVYGKHQLTEKIVYQPIAVVFVYYLMLYLRPEHLYKRFYLHLKAEAFPVLHNNSVYAVYI